MPTIEQIFSNKTALQELLSTPSSKSFPALKKSFLDSIAENCAGIKKAAVLFSGGLDSSIIAKAVSEKVPVKLFSVGLQDSPAFSFSEKAAVLLGLPLERVAVKKSDLPFFLEKTKAIISSNAFFQLQIAVPEFIAMNAAKEHNFQHVFCGQGADELFFGYDEFRRCLENGASFLQLDELRKQKLFDFWRDNLSRDLAVANHFSLGLKAPFLFPPFIKQALAFSAKENILSENDFLRKRILRELAESLLVPKEISQRKKKAIQYDSGLSKGLKKLWPVKDK